MQWFRDRILNRRPWFRIDVGVDILEGRKSDTGQLELTLRIMGQYFYLKLNRETADKLSSWMSRNYPVNRGNNVVQLHKLVSVPKASPDSEGNPGNP